MKRRTLLGCATGAVAATAGCLDAVPLLGGEPPLRLRTMRAEVEPPNAGPEEVTGPTDVTCQLGEDFVGEHPELGRMLRRASQQPVNEMVSTGIDQETGDDIVIGLEAYCERSGGLYFYEGDAYWISIVFTSEEGAIAHHAGDGHNHTHTIE